MAPEEPDDTDASSPPRQRVRRVHAVQVDQPHILWVIPVVAVLYTVLVLLLASGAIPAFMEVGTAVGLGVALLLALLVVLWLLSRRKEVEVEDGEAVVDPEERVWSAYDEDEEETVLSPETEELTAGGADEDVGSLMDPDEVSATEPAEEPERPAIQEGRDFTWAWDDGVASVTRPPRERAGGAAVYHTTRVQVSDDVTLHLEERIAKGGAS